MNWLNFPKEYNDCVYPFPLDCLSSLKLDSGDASATPMHTDDEQTAQKVTSTEKVESDTTIEMLQGVKEDTEEPDSSTVSDNRKEESCVPLDKAEVSGQCDGENGDVASADVGDKRSVCILFVDLDFGFSIVSCISIFKLILEYICFRKTI